jgi:hypothetical protein
VEKWSQSIWLWHWKVTLYSGFNQPEIWTQISISESACRHTWHLFTLAWAKEQSKLIIISSSQTLVIQILAPTSYNCRQRKFITSETCRGSVTVPFRNLSSKNSNLPNNYASTFTANCSTTTSSLWQMVRKIGYHWSLENSGILLLSGHPTELFLYSFLGRKWQILQWLVIY